MRRVIPYNCHFVGKVIRGQDVVQVEGPSCATRSISSTTYSPEVERFIFLYIAEEVQDAAITPLRGFCRLLLCLL